MAVINNNPNRKYEYLDRLSTERLEELLRLDSDLSRDDKDDEYIDAIAEVMIKREKELSTGRLTNTNKAWADFRKHYNTPEGEDLSLHSDEEPDSEAKAISPEPKPLTFAPKCRRLHRVIAAAAVFALLAGMLMAQAMGIDVFGAIARWTSETFRFESASDNMRPSNTSTEISPESSANRDTLQSALEDCGITELLVPAWYPDGYSMDKPEISQRIGVDKIYCSFRNDEDGFFSLQIRRYSSESDVSSLTFEKDDTPVEQYIKNGMTFYILSNEDTATATWSDGRLVEIISGSLSATDLKAMIDSIGG